ncbi:MAG TPA: glycosyltransferase [Phycisphaerae bacterium]|nr:glycosyltransferase [Phycisphaerae bacterium]
MASGEIGAGEAACGRKRLRVVHVVSSLAASAGGVARAVADSAHAVAQASPRVEVHVLSYDGGPFDFPWGDAPAANLHVHLLPPVGKANRASRGYLELLRSLLSPGNARQDVGRSLVHLHGMWEPLLAAAAKVARGAAAPYVCSIHGMLDPWSVSQRRWKKSVYFQLVERRRLAGAAALHFTAQAEAAKAAAWLPEGPPQLVIPVIMDLSPFRRLPERSAAEAQFPGIPAGAPWILFLSRIHEKKGLDLLIDAVSRLGDRAVQLVIAGAGEAHYEELMRARAKDAGIGERAHFVGLVRGTAKVALLRRADLLAIPTSQENFGIVFPEALVCETPVLLTKDVDIHEELLAANAATLIRRDPADIAEKIAESLANREGARQRGAAGRRWVLETLAPEKIAQRWVAAYEELSGARSA